MAKLNVNTGFDEGWGIFENDDGSIHVQRLDDPQACGLFPEGTAPLFSSDEVARAFVQSKAQAGSELHQLALDATRGPTGRE